MMTLAHNESDKRIHIAIKVICALVIATSFIVGFVLYKAPIGQISLFLLYFLFCVQMPGLQISKWLYLDRGYFSTRLVLGALFGWILVVGEYFAANALQHSILPYLCGPALSVAYLRHFISVKGGREELKYFLRAKNLSSAFCIFITLIFLYCMLNTQYLYPNPEIDQLIYVNPDKAFHMGLINSLSHDYPIQGIWFSGVYFYYHIFTDILYAVPVILLNISADACVVSITPILTTYIFGTVLYSFFSEMSSKPNRAGIYCLVFFLSNMFIVRNIKTSLAWFFLIRNDNAAGFATAVALAFTVVFRKWYEEIDSRDSKSIRLLIACNLLIMLATGIKGTIGAMIAASLWGVIILGLALRRISIKTIPAVLTITASFLLIYLTVLAAKGQLNSSTSPALALASISDASFWKEPLVDMLKAAGIPIIARWLAVLFTFLVFFLTAFFVPFCVGYVRELVLVLGGRKCYDPARVLVYSECMVGMLAMLLLYFEGNSEVYFGLITLSLVPMVSFWFIEDLEREIDTKQRSYMMLRTITIIMTGTLLITSCLLGAFYIENVESAAKSADVNKKHNKYMSISNDEYRAMKWIEKNTDEDALVASDRYYSISLKRYSYKNRWKNRFFMYEAYSNRFCYISGSGYILHEEDNPERKKRIDNVNYLYNPEYAARGDLARSLGIEYIILSKRFSGERELANDDYELCYSNADVDIFKIKE